MKRLTTLLTGVLLAVAAFAQTAPDLRLHTTIYNTYGATNAFTLTLGAAPGYTGYADVICSGGNQSEAEIVEAHFSTDGYSLLGTNVACQVDAAGIVEVYCDEGVVLDYICVTGAEITSIEVKNPRAVEILSLEHNALQSLDLTEFTNLSALYLNDNPFDVAPLIVGRNKPNLQILEISQVGSLDPEFDILSYSSLQSFDAMSTYDLHTLTPAGCPNLKKISVDNTNIETLDLSHNPELLILNISETRIKEIDVRQCTKLQQLFATHTSAMNTDIALKSIDVTNCPDLIYLFLSGNDLTTLDVTNNPLLQDLYAPGNHLTGIDLSNNLQLVNVFLQKNDMNFNTLPIPKDTWLDYNLNQRPIRIPKTVKVGDPIDLSAKVIRQDSETDMALIQSTSDIYTEYDPEMYTFADGVITIDTAMPDSVYMRFYNTTFPDITLETSVFKVKTAEDYGKDDKMIVVSSVLTSGKPVQMYVGMAGATSDKPKTFYVDLGNGEKTPFTAASSTMPETPNVDAVKPSFGQMIVYVPQDEAITAFGIKDMAISGLNLAPCSQLADLVLVNTKLSNLDLAWNNKLARIEITGNNFGDSFTLEGANGYYSKNFLRDICLSNNNMTNVKLNDPYAWLNLDLSNNRLEELNFTDADNLRTLNVSHNNLELLKINYCACLESLDASYNRLDSIMYPEDFNLKYVNVGNNCFTMANMPERRGLDETHFVYAPQAVIEIPNKGPGYNLGDQVRDIDGMTTAFAWYDTDGNLMTEGADYTIVGGVTRFADSTIGKNLYCVISHPVYPALRGENALHTTAMLSAGMPTNLLGTFTTPVGGRPVRLSIASSKASDALYIDWTGTSSLDQYAMTNTYTVYNPVTTAGAEVKVWSYDDDDALTVFSVTGATMADADFSPMKHIANLTISGAGLSEIGLPQSPGLTQLSLDGNNFSEFDFGYYPNLAFASFSNNQFTTLDLTPAKKLQSAYFSNNSIAEVKLDNPRMWELALNNNLIESIDLSGIPGIEQLYLNYNKLSHIDLSSLGQLRVIYLDHNRFDFSTLPVPQSQWILYTYGGQPEIWIEPGVSVVDLSYLAERDGVASEFTWFYGFPSLDDEGNLTGEILYVDDEYTIENGVTTFMSNIDRACCVITNSLFPRTYLMTNEVSVTSAGIGEISSDADVRYVVNGRVISVTGLESGASVSIFNAAGSIVAKLKADKSGTASASLPASGMYIVTTPASSAKVCVR